MLISTIEHALNESPLPYFPNCLPHKLTPNYFYQCSVAQRLQAPAPGSHVLSSPRPIVPLKAVQKLLWIRTFIIWYLLMRIPDPALSEARQALAGFVSSFHNPFDFCTWRNVIAYLRGREAQVDRKRNLQEYGE